MDGTIIEGEPFEPGTRVLITSGIFRRELVHATQPTTSCILFVPGASGDSERFDPFVERLTDTGFDVLRFGGWSGIDAVAELRIQDMLVALEDTVKLLSDRGYTFIGVVAKSFGGIFALLGRLRGVDRIVLWAPAIGYGAQTDMERSIGSFTQLTDIAISEEELAERTEPVLLVAGTRDEVLPLERAERIASALPAGELLVVEEGHSVDKNEKSIERTIGFFAR
jgi:pimeloyl-ACP methyl ester carboxylesterase